jgi:chromosome segregation ATPase
MRRIQSTAQDPDVEESRAELEHLEGKKNTAQVDVLAIAANKKQLEADFEEVKQRLDAQIEAKKEELESITNASAKYLHEIASFKRIADSARDKAIAEREQAEKVFEIVKASVAGQTVKKESLDEVIKSLTSIEHRLRSSIAHLAPQERTFEVKKVKLFKEVVDLEDKIATLMASHGQVHSAHNEEKRAHESMVASKEVVQKEIADLKESLASQSRLLSAGGNELVDIQKKRAEHEAEMQKRESAANARMKNAAMLEQAVNVKLEKLKEAEAEFTTSHLARMGYKSIAP